MLMPCRRRRKKGVGEGVEEAREVLGVWGKQERCGWESGGVGEVIKTVRFTNYMNRKK